MIVVPRPALGVDLEAPLDHGQPVRQAAQARALLGVGAAHAVVAHLHHQPPIVALHVHGGVAGLGVLGHVGERLGHHVVRGQLHRLGQPLAGQGGRARPAPARAGPASRARCRARGRSAPRGGCRGPARAAPPARRRAPRPRRRSSASAASGSSRSLSRAMRRFSAIDTRRCWAPSWRSRSSRRRSSSPIRSMRSREARSSPTLARSSASRRSFFERQRRGGAHRAHVVAGVAQRGVVDDGGHALALALDLGHRAARAVLRQLEGAALGVHETLVARAASRRARARDRPSARGQRVAQLAAVAAPRRGGRSARPPPRSGTCAPAKAARNR